MKVIIIGQSGFVGSNLFSFLKILGVDVLDIPRGDITDSHYRKLILSRKPDAVINLASYGNDSTHDQNSIAGLIKTNSVNLVGAIQLFNDCLRSGVKLFIQAGSSSEYGTHYSPLSIDTPLEGKTPYARTKSLFFHFLESMSDCPMKIKYLRLFSVYGPQEKPHRFIPTLIRASKTGETVPLSEGSHDFVYVDDVCDAFYRLLTKPDTPFVSHSATGKQYSNKEVVEIVEKISGKKINTYSAKLRTFDTNYWVSSYKDLLVKPNFSLEQGIKRMYDQI